jgi:hypothetical protein
VKATIARIRRSTLTPPGKNSGTVTADFNSTVSKATRRLETSLAFVCVFR